VAATGRAGTRRRTQEERRAATRAALLDATIECVVEDGYAGTTTTRVVERERKSTAATRRTDFLNDTSEKTQSRHCSARPFSPPIVQHLTPTAMADQRTQSRCSMNSRPALWAACCASRSVANDRNSDGIQ